MPDLGIGREYFYKQINRLDYVSSEGLNDIPNEAGLYAVFQEGETLEIPIAGLPEDTLRCVKIGMTKSSLITRISDQYFKGNHRSSVVRKHVGDAYLTKAISEQIGFKNIPFDQLIEMRQIWNIGNSNTDALRKKPDVAGRLKINNSGELKKKEMLIEENVSTYLEEFRFIIIPCSQDAITQIEDKANSFLRDTTTEYDHPSVLWLGRYSSNETIRQNGLWAVDGVQDAGRHKYLPYVNHPANENCLNENGKVIADWLGLLKGIIDQTENN